MTSLEHQFEDACYFGDYEGVIKVLKNKSEWQWDNGVCQACDGAYYGFYRKLPKRHLEIVELMIQKGANNYHEIRLDMTRQLLNRGHLQIQNKYTDKLHEERKQRQDKIKQAMTEIVIQKSSNLHLFDLDVLDKIILPYVAF